jgi:hypothetical protein
VVSVIHVLIRETAAIELLGSLTLAFLNCFVKFIIVLGTCVVDFIAGFKAIIEIHVQLIHKVFAGFCTCHF